MRLKKKKADLLQEIINSYPYPSYNLPDLSSIPMDRFKTEIENYTREMTRVAVRDAFETLFENIYTDEEFEEDMQLKS